MYSLHASDATLNLTFDSMSDLSRQLYGCLMTCGYMMLLLYETADADAALTN